MSSTLHNKQRQSIVCVKIPLQNYFNFTKWIKQIYPYNIMKKRGFIWKQSATCKETCKPNTTIAVAGLCCVCMRFFFSLVFIPLGAKRGLWSVSVMLSSRPTYRGRHDEYPPVLASPPLRVEIEAKLFPYCRLIVLFVHSTQGWALMRLMVI